MFIYITNNSIFCPEGLLSQTDIILFYASTLYKRVFTENRLYFDAVSILYFLRNRIFRMKKFNHLRKNTVKIIF